MMRFDTITLEPLKFYAQERIASQLAYDVNFQTFMARETDHLIMRLDASIMGKRREFAVEEVPYSKTVGIERYASWWQGFKWDWIAKRWPRKTVIENVRVVGSVKVDRHLWDTFPESKIKWPKDLGRVVVHETASAEWDYGA